MSLRLLHLSDIHFSVDGWDEDADQRNELIRDLKLLVADGGPVDGVLIGGDIAFSAKAAEYDVALTWIDKVLDACDGLDRADVWTVPGNHDIDREAVKSSTTALGFRLDLATCDLEGVDYHLKKRLSQSSDGEELMRPLEAYNDFALNFSCSVVPEAPRWFDERTLVVDDWRLRLVGITSVLTSGAGNEKGNLVVGCQQARIERKDNVIDLVMMHHPPRWLRDWDHIEPYMRRAHLWVFGHEHAYAAQQRNPGGSVEVSAGAVAPERDAHGESEPFVASYNIITLSRTENDELRVEILPRYWNRDSTQFDMHPDGPSDFIVELSPPAPQVQLHEEEEELTESEHSELESASAVPLAPELSAEAPALTKDEAERMQLLRRVGVEYLGLPTHRRIGIAKTLGVLQEGDMNSRPAELFPILLRRIRDQGLIEQLKEEISN